jgi:Protein of unknown function (DUF2934)
MSQRMTRTLRRKTALTAVTRSRGPNLHASLSDEPAASSAPEPDAAPPCAVAPIEPDQRRAMIAEAAYYRSERRSFAPGHEFEDWTEAEREIDAQA